MSAPSTMWVRRGVRVAALSDSTRRNQTVSAPSGFELSKTPPRVFSKWEPAMRNVVASKWTGPTESDTVKTLVSKKLHQIHSIELAESLLSDFNKNVLWNKYSTIHQLCQLERKEDILTVLQTYQFISKKSVHLFSALSRTIIAHQHDYSAAELGDVMHIFAQLGFLDESFCVQLANRIVADIQSCTLPKHTVNLFDAFATTRSSVESVIDVLVDRSFALISQFTPDQLSLLASCLARLNVKDDALCECVAQHWLIQTNDMAEANFQDEALLLTSRDITLIAYAFGKMQGVSTLPELQENVVRLAQQQIRDFTAKELQMLVTGIDRWGISLDTLLGESISEQAQRRIAQFSSESLVQFLKVFPKDDALLCRAVCELPRLGQSLKPGEIADLFEVFGQSSPAALQVLAPLAVASSGLMGPTEWVQILESAQPDIVVEAFNLINTSRPQYRNSGQPVSHTVLERMNVSQLVKLVNVPIVSKHLLERIQKVSPDECAELYCELIKNNVTNDEVLKTVFSKSLEI